MSLAPVADADLRAELWASFTALLRSYASAASQHASRHQVHDIADCETHVTAGDQVLELWCNPSSGVGEWALQEVQPGSRGALLFNVDGTITIDGGTLDMDHAAIDLIAFLGKAASQDRIEVPA